MRVEIKENNEGKNVREKHEGKNKERHEDKNMRKTRG